MSELKCCPFCGGDAKIATYDWGYSVKEYWIYCNPCDCASGRYHSKEEAISAWNTRKPMANIVEKLEKESKKKHNKERDVLCKIANASYSAGVEYAINIVKQEINNGSSI